MMTMLDANGWCNCQMVGPGSSRNFPRVFCVLILVALCTTLLFSMHKFGEISIGCENTRGVPYRTMSSNTSSAPFQYVSRADRTMFIFGAFLEDDTKSGLNEVRLIGVSTKTQRHIQCLVWHNDTTKPPIKVTARVEKINRSPSKTAGYISSFFICYLCDRSHPIAVSVVDDGTTNAPQNLFRVWPSPSCPSCQQKQYSISICVSPVHGSYDKSPVHGSFDKSPLHASFDQTWRLVEWIVLNQILGVEHFVFYIESISDEVSQVLEYYQNEGIVDIVYWPINTYSDPNIVLDYYGQQAATNDCLYRLKDVSEFMISIDLDEFIIPQNIADITLQDMMFRMPDSSKYMFRHAGFNPASVLPMDFSNEERLLTQEIVFRDSDIKPKSTRTKVMVRTKDVYAFGVHDTWGLKRGETTVADPEIGLLHHYRLHNVDKTALYVKHTAALKYAEQLKSQMWSVKHNFKKYNIML